MDWIFARSALYVGAHKIRLPNSVRAFVRPCVRPFRKIITFWEGDMRVVRIHLPTGSLKLGFLASPENIRLNFD